MMNSFWYEPWNEANKNLRKVKLLVKLFRRKKWSLIVHPIKINFSYFDKKGVICKIGKQTK